MEAGVYTLGEPKRFVKLLDAFRLTYIAQVVTDKESVDWQKHGNSFREQVQ